MTFSDFLELAQVGGSLLVAVLLVRYLLQIGKAIGRMEQLLKTHSKDIEKLQETKVDKEVCAAITGKDDHD